LLPQHVCGPLNKSSLLPWTWYVVALYQCPQNHICKCMVVSCSLGFLYSLFVSALLQVDFVTCWAWFLCNYCRHNAVSCSIAKLSASSATVHRLVLALCRGWTLIILEHCLTWYFWKMSK
jgi:hypothetical protein